MPLKAVIFDMDDTLVDWSNRAVDWRDYEREHLQNVYAYLVRDVHPLDITLDVFFELVMSQMRDAWWDSSRGLRAPSRATILTKAITAAGVPAEKIDPQAALKAYNWQAVGGVVAFPDALEILPLLVKHNVKIGLITNTDLPIWMRDIELEAVGLLAHFAACRLTAADVGYLKPHPAIFETALQCLDAKPDEAVFVGDNPEADVAGAQSIGMRGVLRVGLHVPPMISGLIIPDGAINTLHDLLPMLDEWYPDWRSQTATKSTIQRIDAKVEALTEQLAEKKEDSDAASTSPLS